MLLGTTITGRFPYSRDPPPHIAYLASFMNTTLDNAQTGYQDCSLTESIECPAGTHHNPDLQYTFDVDECLGA